MQQTKPAPRQRRAEPAPAADSCHLNSSVEILKGEPWQQMLSQIGDALMLHLLMHAAIFQPLPNGCFLQLTGTAVDQVTIVPLHHKTWRKACNMQSVQANSEHAYLEQVAKKINANTLGSAALALQPEGQDDALPEPSNAVSSVPRCISPRSQEFASPGARSQASGGLAVIYTVLSTRLCCSAGSRFAQPSTFSNMIIGLTDSATVGLSEDRQCHVMPIGAALAKEDICSASKLSGKRARRSARPSSWQRRRAARLLQAQTLHDASGIANTDPISRLSCKEL